MRSDRVVKKQSSTKRQYAVAAIVAISFILGSVAGLAIGSRHQGETFTTKKGTKVYYSSLDQKESAKPATFSPNISPDNDLDKYPGLSATLLDYDERPCPTFFQGTYRQIILGITPDKTQALVAHSCGAAGVERSFMVKQADGSWLKIGAPGFKFRHQVAGDMSELLDLPSCTLVATYAIQKSIAPVCYNKLPGKSQLVLGDWNNYSYTIRTD